MKSSILLTHNRKLKIILAAVKTGRRVVDTELKVARETIAQLEGRLKIATDIGADRNRLQSVWVEITKALNRSAVGWFIGNGTPAELAPKAIESLAAEIARYHGICAQKSGAAKENERKYLALEVENKDLRVGRGYLEGKIASLQRSVQDGVDQLKAAQETIDSQNRTLRRQADEASKGPLGQQARSWEAVHALLCEVAKDCPAGDLSKECGCDHALRKIRFLVTKAENATNRDERSQAELQRVYCFLGRLHDKFKSLSVPARVSFVAGLEANLDWVLKEFTSLKQHSVCRTSIEKELAGMIDRPCGIVESIRELFARNDRQRVVINEICQLLQIPSGRDVNIDGPVKNAIAVLQTELAGAKACAVLWENKWRDLNRDVQIYGRGGRAVRIY